MKPSQLINLSDAAHAARGFAMGAAQIVPGVSGGTVALVLGIYQRLLEALSSFDGKLVALLMRRDIRAAAEHIDLRFLIALGVGAGVALGGLAELMHYLLEHQRGLTYAAFFGFILASGVLVGRMCRPQGAVQIALCFAIGIAAAGGAYWLMAQDRLTAQPGLLYTFFCGAVSICAMILPGISGSHLLLMLGKYHEITGIIKDTPKLAVDGGQLATLAVFATGCVAGLLLFSRLLKWLLARCWSPTMAALCGFMVGSLYKLWPLQVDTTPSEEKFKLKVFEPIWPEAVDSHVAACLAIAVASFFGVLLIDALANRHEANADAQPAE